MKLDRRAFLAAAARAGLALPGLSSLGALAGCAGRLAETAQGEGESLRFRHGVASGDPLADRVVLWTRVEARAATPVRWRVARDPELRDLVGEGRTLAAPERDFTVKLDVGGLEPGATYWYGFEALGEASPVGRTRTLRAGPTERLRLAFASCANLTQGFWNAYAAMARRDDLDLVLHLGDYLYEFANGTYGDGRDLGRVPEPDRELVTLADYRTRYAQYRRDPDLQALHARHPMIAVWDDHEIADDTWLGGAGNHQPASEGRWVDRRAAAVRAYLEWLPVREEGMPAPEDKPQLWRSFRIGDLAELAMLDTRLAGRAHQLPAAERALLADPARSLLGAEQEAWLFERLAVSQREGVVWRLLGQQVMFGQLRTAAGLIGNPDSWDGYPAARERVLRRIQSEAIDNVVVLSGDVHSSWGLELALDPFDPRAYDPSTGRGALAVELVCPAVSSAPPVRDRADAAAREAGYRARFPHLRYLDLWHRGYGILDLDRERARAEWWHVDTVEQRSPAEHLGAALETRSGTHRLERAPS
jgi:alkaline phosphatase D